MAKTLRKVRAGSPLFTNAYCNRRAAEKAFLAGVTAEQIAEFWPEVWKLSKDSNGRSVIGQRYDYELADDTGRYETDRRITDQSVRECIARYVTKGSADGQ